MSNLMKALIGIVVLSLAMFVIYSLSRRPEGQPTQERAIAATYCAKIRSLAYTGVETGRGTTVEELFDPEDRTDPWGTPISITTTERVPFVVQIAGPDKQFQPRPLRPCDDIYIYEEAVVYLDDPLSDIHGSLIRTRHYWLAEVLLNSGDTSYARIARDWAAANGYEVTSLNLLKFPTPEEGQQPTE